MLSQFASATTIVSSSSRWLSGVMRGSIDINPRSRTDDTYLPWQTNGKYGGISGTHYFQDIPQRAHTPVVFVHGNTGDATDWLPMMEAFLETDYTGEDLWAISFRRSSPSHEEMGAQLDEFVRNVMEFTGYDSVHVVSHSLGVTGVRYWLEQYERHSCVEKFIGLAGANHGSSRCKLLDSSHFTVGSNRTSWFLNPENMDDSSHPLQKLNENETPGDIEYYTLRASSDRFFRQNPKSPELAGAENEVIEANHMNLLTKEESIQTVYNWLNES